MDNQSTKTEQNETLQLDDLFSDQDNDELTEYLSLSIEHIDGDTNISLTTVEASPTTYSSSLNQITSSSLQNLILGNEDLAT